MIEHSLGVKKKIIYNLFKRLKNKKNIESATFVGSFVDKNNFDEINDIDLIVIVKKLNKNIFEKIIKSLKTFNPKKLNINKKLYINSTFGPLKFNNKNDLVIHLMIYDLKGHIQHCINSPFTVYDWERSKFFFKKNMSDIFPVGNIQLEDFLNARRGIKNYLYDLLQKKISYREYNFFGNKYHTVKKMHNLKDRDKFEYYYHIIKNLILNYVKFKEKKNKLFKFTKNNQMFLNHFGNSFYKKYVQNINFLIDLKKKRNFNLSKFKENWIVSFIKDFERKINNELKHSKQIFFVRHAKTFFNDGSFFGQKLDPDILNISYKIKKNYFDKVISSPLKRSIQTVNIISKNENYLIDKNLLEIDYGKAEGLTINQLKKKFPEMIKNWKAGNDPSFPSGESYKDINFRKNKFIKRIKKIKFKNICVITHNIFIKCLIGQIFNIPKRYWYKIYIPHLMQIKFIIINNVIYPNIPRSKFKTLFSNFIL